MTTKTKSATKRDLLDAADAGDFDLVTQLIQEGSNPNFSSDNGWTPLMLAVMHSPLRIAELLLKSGADPNLVTESQENPRRTALAVAVSNGQVEAVKLLLEYRADVAATDTIGVTPLDLARKLARRPLRREAMQEIVSILSRRRATGAGRDLLMTSAG